MELLFVCLKVRERKQTIFFNILYRLNVARKGNLKQCGKNETILSHRIFPAQVLDKARKRLSDVIQERTRVLDLICHAIPSISASAGHVTLRSRNFNTSYNVRPASVNGMSPMQDVDPLGAYTPEVDATLKDAKAARERCVLKTIFIKMPQLFPVLSRMCIITT